MQVKDLSSKVTLKVATYAVESLKDNEKYVTTIMKSHSN